MQRKLFVSVFAVSAAALGGVGCGDARALDVEEVDGETVEESASALTAASRRVEGTTVASIRTSSNTLVTFVSGPDDELGVGIIGTVGAPDDELEQAQRIAGSDPVALYERLAKAQAPEALKEAAGRVDSGRFRVDASDEGETAGAASGSTLTAGAAPMAASDLCDITNSAHSGSGKFTYCWPNQHSTPWVKRKADHMSCRFDTVDGPQRVRYRFKSGGNWHTTADYWLGSGEYMQWTGAYKWAQRWRECKTVDNPHGRKHHFRVVGHEWLAGLVYNPLTVSFPNP